MSGEPIQICKNKVYKHQMFMKKKKNNEKSVYKKLLLTGMNNVNTTNYCESKY